ncbi:MAG: ATP-binding protein [Candidatus Zixiibacteriota bacterium]
MKKLAFAGQSLTVQTKMIILSAVVLVTVAIHYGWPLMAVFGHTSWGHALHSRFCYIPIAIAAAWFGLRGGVLAATAISLLVVPYLFGLGSHSADLSNEFVEIIFYYAIGILIGALIDRELRVRRQQEETQLQLERSQRLSLVGQMAAGVAHEIKNPLASIKGAMEIMTDDTVSESDRVEFREVMNREIKRIDGTVMDFLAFARPREANMQKIDLSSALEQAVRQVSPKVTSSGMSITTHIAPAVTIIGDAEKLHQAFANLILNSVEASVSGARIDVALTSNDHEASITLRDYGCGIPPTHLGRIFEPFFSTKASGTGLGLAIVKSIIEAHNGSIAVTSKPEISTTFAITLPLAGGTR